MTDDADVSVACYYCGSSVSSAVPGRLDECPNCGKYIHVCRMCTYYDVNETSKQCAQDDAEEVRDKQAANFCDYFKLASDTFDAAGIRAHTAAKAELAGLFGDSSSDQSADPSTSKTRLMQDAEALFKK